MHGRGVTGNIPQQRWRGLASRAAPLIFAGFFAGCSSTNSADTAASPPPASHGFSLTQMFGSSSAKAPQTAAGAQPDVNCPPVDIRRGAGTLAIGPDSEKTALTLKYQIEFTREARDCAVSGNMMVMRVGVEGRVVLGPAGGPGQVNVPLRMAVVRETPSGGTQPVQTKFVLIPVVIGPNQGSAAFAHVEEGLTFPMPTPTAQLDDYIVYIGFDPQSAQIQSEKPAPGKKHKSKPQPSASAN